VGRLRDERAAFREALAYETMEWLGLVSPRVRRALLDYRDTTAASDPASTGWQVRRHAFILEDIEVVAERLGGRALSDEEIGALAEVNFDPQLLTDLQLLHALFGNWDYQISPGGQGIWNTEVIALPNQQLLPVAGDFDLASWVTGEVRLAAPHDYRPDLPDLERQIRYEIEQIQQRVSSASFDTGLQRYRAARAGIEAQIDSAEIDEEGRGNARQHVIAFYDALAAVRP
jgi:hypothetical protein